MEYSLLGCVGGSGWWLGGQWSMEMEKHKTVENSKIMKLLICVYFALPGCVQGQVH